MSNCAQEHRYTTNSGRCRLIGQIMEKLLDILSYKFKFRSTSKKTKLDPQYNCHI